MISLILVLHTLLALLSCPPFALGVTLLLTQVNFYPTVIYYDLVPVSYFLVENISNHEYFVDSYKNYTDFYHVLVLPRMIVADTIISLIGTNLYKLLQCFSIRIVATRSYG